MKQPNKHRSENEVSEQGLETHSLPLEPSETSPWEDRPNVGTPISGNLPVIPGHEIIQEVGRGGMGVVLKARHVELDRMVAVKLPRAGLIETEQDRERFLREAKTAAQLRHPNICSIHSIGDIDGLPYLTMDFIEGPTLRDWARKQSPNAREAAQTVAVLARAVAHAHEHDVLHRDIKPSNCLIDQATGQPVLMDFGLAKQLAVESNSDLTRSGQVMGTPAYMAPEQAAGKNDQVGPLSDVYALGAVLYELVGGKPPFEGTVGEVLWKVQTESPVPLRKRVPRLHRDLETICETAMAKAPSDRYASATALAEDLERFCQGEAIMARRLGPVVRTLRAVKRRPLVAVAWVALMAVIAGVILASFLAVRGVRNQEVATLLADLETELDADDWSAERLDSIDRLIESLGRAAPEHVSTSRSRVVERLAASIQRDLDQAVLAPTSLERVEASLTLLDTQDSARADQLRDALSGRLRRWDTLFDLHEPFDDRDRILPPDQVSVEGDVLVRAEVEQAGPVLHVQTGGIGAVRLEATFDDSWSGANTLGLHLGSEEGHRDQIQHLAVSGDGRRLASADASGSIKLWDLRGSHGLASLGFGREPVECLVFSHDSRFLAAGGQEVVLWEVAAAEVDPKPRFRLAVPAIAVALSEVSDVTDASKSGQSLSVYTEAGTIQRFDVDDGQLIETLDSGLGPCRLAAFSPDGTAAAMVDQQGRLFLWPSIGTTQPKPMETFLTSIRSLVFDPRGKRLAMIGDETDRRGALWLGDVSSGKGARLEEISDQCVQVVFDASGVRLAAHTRGRGRSVVRIWYLNTSQHGPTHNRGESTVSAMAFTPNDRKLLMTDDLTISMTDTMTGVVSQTFRPRGYRFLVHTGVVKPKASVEGSTVSSKPRSQPAPARIEIYRDTSLLASTPLRTRLLSGGPLRVRAEQVGERLRLEVGSLTPLEVRDPFPYVGGGSRQFALHWPKGVGLVQLKATRQALPLVPSPLERADLLYSLGRLSEALTLYEEQVSRATSAERSQEARYKRALCLVGLERGSEAERLLEEVAGSQGERWPPLAACQLWLQLLRQGRLDEADAIFESLVVRFSVSELASLVPVGSRRAIVGEYIKPIQGAGYYRSGHDRARQAERAFEVTKHMSSSSSLIAYTQKDMIRAFHMAGKEELALEKSAEVIRKLDPHVLPIGVEAAILAEYAWMLRTAGKLDQARDLLNRWPAPRRARSEDFGLVREQVATLVALGRYDEAEQRLLKYIEMYGPENLSHHTPSAYAMAGFLREEAGDSEGAMKAWNRGLELTRVKGRFTLKTGFSIMEEMFLVALTGQVTDEDVRVLIERVVGDSGANSSPNTGLAFVRGKSLPIGTITSAFREAFTSTRGRPHIRQIVFRQVSFRDCVRIPPMLIVSETIEQGAFDNRPTDEQAALIWMLANLAYIEIIEQRHIQPAQIVQLLLAWRGTSGFLGWDGIAPSLDPTFRGPIAVCLGHRYLKLGMTDEARRIFQTTLDESTEDSPQHHLAQLALDAIDKP